jgi:Rod binding domain-containing protein
MSTSAIGAKPTLAASTLPPSMTTKLSPGIVASLAPGVAAKLAPGVAAKARATATDFEQVFLNSMFSQMFTGIDGDGPFGGGKATGVWRSFLTDEYAKSFAKAGGIGLGDHIYRALIAQQEARSK